MRTIGDRLITPLMLLSAACLLVGLHTPAQSSPAADSTARSEKGVQTHPTQTRPAKAQHPPSRPAKRRSSPKPAPENPRVFTNDDLKRYHSDASTSPARTTPAPAPSGDPLRALKDQQERSRWRQEKITTMQQNILNLEGKLKELEQKRLSVVNPYVPRPQEGTNEKAEEKGLSGPELLARTEGEIRQTTQDLESARKALATFLETTPE